MKTIFALALSILWIGVFSQNIGINNSGATPDASAILDVDDTTKGFLPPRHTTVQRDLIPNPAIGLQVYNLDTKCLDIFDGTSWRSYCPDPIPVTDCPLGMIDFGSFSIEQTAHPVANFPSAVLFCGNLGNKTRLCSLAEWREACTSIPFPFIGDDWEWVDDALQENEVLAVGGGACSAMWAQSVANDRFFRCCCEH